MAHYLVISGEGNWAYSVELDQGTTYKIGRADDNNIVLKDRRVSSYHSRVLCEDGVFIISDLESRNGTVVNGSRVRNHKLSPGDKVQLGSSTIQYVDSLDPSQLSGPAILSPRLSQPLLKTEVSRMQDVRTELDRIQDAVARHKYSSEADIDKLAEELAAVSTKLGAVENHFRVLISTNHFHEIFHQPRPPRELYREALRFISGAVEGENAALVLVGGDPGLGTLSVESVIGLSVASWAGSIPHKFESLLRQCMSEKKAIHIRSMSQDQRFQSASTESSTPLTSADNRAILVAPILTGRGKVLGAAYFDNISRPTRLVAATADMATGCLAILGDHIVGESQSESRSTGGKGARAASPPPTMLSEETEINQTLY